MILHPQLGKDSIFICDLSLCQVRRIKDGNYPWLVLIPKRDDVTEIIHLSKDDQILLMADIDLASKVLIDLYAPDKLNVAALGNMVPQLHVHVIARYKKDAAWPAPVWGKVPAIDLADDDVQILQQKFTALLAA